MSKTVTKTVRQLLEEAIRDDQGWCALRDVVDVIPEFCDRHGDAVFDTSYEAHHGVLSMHPVAGRYYSVKKRSVGLCALAFRGVLVGIAKESYDNPTDFGWVSMEAYRDVVTYLRLINTASPVDSDRFVDVLEDLHQAVEVNND